jgi:hypothetical protein
LGDSASVCEQLKQNKYQLLLLTYPKFMTHGTAYNMAITLHFYRIKNNMAQSEATEMMRHHK